MIGIIDKKSLTSHSLNNIYQVYQHCKQIQAILQSFDIVAINMCRVISFDGHTLHLVTKKPAYRMSLRMYSQEYIETMRAHDTLKNLQEIKVTLV